MVFALIFRAYPYGGGANNGDAGSGSSNHGVRLLERQKHHTCH